MNEPELRVAVARSEIERPLLPPSRVIGHIEEVAAYRLKNRQAQALDAGECLSDGIMKFYKRNMARAEGNPILEQYHRRIEAAIVVGASDNIALYLEQAVQCSG